MLLILCAKHKFERFLPFFQNASYIMCKTSVGSDFFSCSSSSSSFFSKYKKFILIITFVNAKLEASRALKQNLPKVCHTVIVTLYMKILIHS